MFRELINKEKYSACIKVSLACTEYINKIDR